VAFDGTGVFVRRKTVAAFNALLLACRPLRALRHNTIIFLFTAAAALPYCHSAILWAGRNGACSACWAAFWSLPAMPWPSGSGGSDATC
jgi:hypothetical protein